MGLVVPTTTTIRTTMRRTFVARCSVDDKFQSEQLFRVSSCVC